MRAFPAILMLAALAMVIGCEEQQPTGKSAADLERESRAKTEKIIKLEDELAVARAERDAVKKDLDAARKSPDVEKGFQFVPRKVEFGFLTAAVNLDESGRTTDRKYDNAVAAYVGLYDQFDSSLKVAGAFQFDLMDLSKARDFVIAGWTFEPEAAAKHWQKFPGCYQFKLPLPGDLNSRKVTLKVTFRRPGKPDLTATTDLDVERP